MQIVLQTVMTALFVGKHVAVVLVLFGLETEWLEENTGLKLEPCASPTRHILIVQKADVVFLQLHMKTEKN